MKSKPYYILVPSEVREALQRRAAQEGVTVASLIRTAIIRYLSRLPPPADPLSPDGDEDIHVRLSDEAEAALERRMLAASAPRHSLNALAKRALAEQLGMPLQAWGEDKLATVSTRLPLSAAEQLHAAARAYSREALIRRALHAYRQRQEG